MKAAEVFSVQPDDVKLLTNTSTFVCTGKAVIAGADINAVEKLTLFVVSSTKGIIWFSI